MSTEMLLITNLNENKFDLAAEVLRDKAGDCEECLSTAIYLENLSKTIRFLTSNYVETKQYHEDLKAENLLNLI